MSDYVNAYDDTDLTMLTDIEIGQRMVILEHYIGSCTVDDKRIIREANLQALQSEANRRYPTRKTS